MALVGGERNFRFLICDNIDFGESRAVIEPGLVWTTEETEERVGAIRRRRTRHGRSLGNLTLVAHSAQLYSSTFCLLHQPVNLISEAKFSLAAQSTHSIAQLVTLTKCKTLQRGFNGNFKRNIMNN